MARWVRLASRRRGWRREIGSGSSTWSRRYWQQWFSWRIGIDARQWRRQRYIKGGTAAKRQRWQCVRVSECGGQCCRTATRYGQRPRFIERARNLGGGNQSRRRLATQFAGGD